MSDSNVFDSIFGEGTTFTPNTNDATNDTNNNTNTQQIQVPAPTQTTAQPTQTQTPVNNNPQAPVTIQPREVPNQHHFHNPNSQEEDVNKSIMDTIHMLGSGDVNNPAANPALPAGADPSQQSSFQQQHQQQFNPNQENDPELAKMKPAERVVHNMLMDPDQQVDFLRGIDQKKLTEQLAEGDPDAFFTALNTVGTNALKNALTMIMETLPQVAESIETKVLQTVSQDNQQNSVWNEFVMKYPQYAPYKSTVNEMLQKAYHINKGNKDIAFPATAQMCSGITTVPSLNPKEPSNNQQPNNKSFDLNTYLGLDE